MYRKKRTYRPKDGLVLLSGGRQIVVEYNRWTGPSFFHLYK
eukprot:COSAG02_NODE_72048_length_188_cov_27.561798_1_plen_40_part_01